MNIYLIIYFHFAIYVWKMHIYVLFLDKFPKMNVSSKASSNQNMENKW